MPATPLPETTRFFQPGTTAIYFVPTIAAATHIPTRAELDAGTDLTAQVADISGWSVAGSTIATPDLASTFNSKIPGMTDAADSSLTFYGDLTGADVRDVLPRGTEGYIVFADGGDVAASPADSFPVRVTGTPKQRGMADAFRIQVDFAITDEPAEDFPLPAAV